MEKSPYYKKNSSAYTNKIFKKIENALRSSANDELNKINKSSYQLKIINEMKCQINELNEIIKNKNDSIDQLNAIIDKLLNHLGNITEIKESGGIIAKRTINTLISEECIKKITIPRIDIIRVKKR